MGSLRERWLEGMIYQGVGCSEPCLERESTGREADSISGRGKKSVRRGFCKRPEAGGGGGLGGGRKTNTSCRGP